MGMRVPCTHACTHSHIRFMVVAWSFTFSGVIGSTGGVTMRLCTSAEISFYFNGFHENDGQASVYLKPNLNCNLSSWVSGCEPGWSCSIGKNQKINLLDKKLLPARTLECRPCCEGFFCPRGITCMMRKYPCLLCALLKLFPTSYRDFF